MENNEAIECIACTIDGSDSGAIFDGTWKDALLAGWVENEWGACCPDCAASEEEFEHGSMADPYDAMKIGKLKQ